MAARDARRAEDLLRRRLLERLAGSPAAVAAAGGPAPAAVLATTRLHDLGPALATYLPAVAQTVVVPPALLLALAWTDLLSAVVELACVDLQTRRPRVMPEGLHAAFAAVNLDSKIRAEKVTLEQFVALAKELHDV